MTYESDGRRTWLIDFWEERHQARQKQMAWSA